MNERMLQYWTQSIQYWNKFNRTSRMLIVGILAATILTIILIIYNNSKVEYASAFTELQPNDAASITSYLGERGIPYKLSEDGTSIGVPRNIVAQVKLDVVGQGLSNSGSIGWGVFREGSILGWTDAQTKIMELEALQGELEQLINTNVAISNSKVLVTQQSDGVYIRDKEPPTASVIVNIRPGYILDQNKIDTMYALVAKSVPSLIVENIAISDQNGDLLPHSSSLNGQTQNTGTIAAQQMQIKRDFEQDLRKEIIRQLAPMIGQDNVVPLVVATLNYDKIVRSSDLVTPVNGESGIVVSSEVRESSSTGSSNGGIAGTGESDVPTYPSVAGSDVASSEDSSRIYNYDYNRIQELLEAQPFYVNDLMVSVGLNTAANFSEETKTAIERTLTSIVGTSLANTGRTYTVDELAAKVTVFEETFIGAAGITEPSSTNWVLYGVIGALAVALAAVGGFLVASRRRNNRTVQEELLMEEVGDIVDAPAKVEYPSIDLDNLTNDNQAKKQLEQLAKKKPDEFVNLLRTWLVDE